MYIPKQIIVKFWLWVFCSPCHYNAHCRDGGTAVACVCRWNLPHFCIGDIFTFAIFWCISYIFILATFPYLLHSYIGNIFKLADFFHLIPFHICYIHFHLLSAESELTLLLSISWGQSKVEMSQHQFPWAEEDWKSISSCWVIIALGGPSWNHH